MAANNAADEINIVDVDEELNAPELDVLDDDPLGSTFHDRKDAANDEGFQTNEETEALRREAEELRNQLAERDARLNEEAQKRVEMSKTVVKMAKTNLEKELTQMESDLVKAKEDGDSKKEVQLEGQLAKKRAELARIEVALENANNAPATPAASTTPQNKQEVNQEDARAAKDWLVKNSWYQKPVNGAEYERKLRAERVNEAMLAEGKFDPRKPEYYREVDRRLAMEEKNNNPRRSPVAGVNHGNNNQQRQQGNKVQVTLTAADKQVMRELKLNPDDPEMRQAYARQKVQVDNRWATDEDNNPQI